MRKRLLNLFIVLTLVLGLMPVLTRTARADNDSISVTVGSGTDKSDYIPVRRYYNYGKTQTVIQKSELSSLNGLDISCLSYYPTNTGTNATIAVYLTETDLDSLTELVDVPESDKVYSGTIRFDADTETPLIFDTPFAYSGGNLLVTVINNTGSYTSGLYFYGTKKQGASVSAVSDSRQFTSSYTGSCTQQGFLPKMTFYTGDETPPPPPDYYDLWICGTQVSSANAGDLSVIDGVDGEVRYDDAKHTLTLHNASIRSNDSSVNTIQVPSDISEFKIEFTGDNTIAARTSSGYCRAIDALYTALVLSGGEEDHLTVQANMSGGSNENGGLRIAALTVSGGSILVSCPMDRSGPLHNPYCISLNQYSENVLKVSGGKLICKGWEPLFYGPAPFTAAQVDSSTILRGTANEDGSELEDYDFITNCDYSGGDYYSTYRYVTAEPAAPYDLYVAGTRVNAGNAADLSVIEGVEGTVSYDDRTKTLSLEHASIINSTAGDHGFGIQYTGTGTFTVQAVGTNTVSVTAPQTQSSAGIAVGTPGEYSTSTPKANLRIYLLGDATLDACGGQAEGGYYPSSYGIVNAFDGDVTVTGAGTVNADGGVTSYSYGVSSSGNFYKTGACTLNAAGADDSFWSTGIAANGNIVLSTGSLNASGGTSSASGAESYGIYGNPYDSKTINITANVKVLATGSTSALNMAATLDSGVSAGASTDISGTGIVFYNKEDNASYKWFQAPVTFYTVTVINGTGSGKYPEGANVAIKANDPESGKVFKEWTGTEGLTFTSGSKTSASASFVMPANDVSVTAAYGQSDPIVAFVTRLYRLCLNREPDEGGLNNWVNQLRSGSKTAAQVVQGFFNSTEMKKLGLSNEEWIERCYLVMMDRASDAGGKKNWVDKYESGVSNNYILKGFVESKEFKKICAEFGIEPGTITLTEARDLNLGITKFVSRCYSEVLGRKGDAGGMNNWCGKILSASDQKQAAIDTASSGFFHSKEFNNRNTTNEQYLTILYNTFFGRAPDTGGYNNWMKRLSSGTSRDEVLMGFANSKEFANLMASYGIK